MDDARKYILEYLGPRVFDNLHTLLIAGDFEKAERLFRTLAECLRLVTILVERCEEVESEGGEV